MSIFNSQKFTYRVTVFTVSGKKFSTTDKATNINELVGTIADYTKAAHIRIEETWINPASIVGVKISPTIVTRIKKLFDF